MNASLFDTTEMNKEKLAVTRPPKGDDFLSPEDLKALTPGLDSAPPPDGLFGGKVPC